MMRRDSSEMSSSTKPSRLCRSNSSMEPSRNAAWVMAAKGYRWPTLPDPAAGVLRQFGLAGTPAFVVIDPAGDVRFVSLGYTSELGLRLRLWWAGRGGP